MDRCFHMLLPATSFKVKVKQAGVKQAGVKQAAVKQSVLSVCL